MYIPLYRPQPNEINKDCKNYTPLKTPIHFGDSVGIYGICKVKGVDTNATYTVYNPGDQIEGELDFEDFPEVEE